MGNVIIRTSCGQEFEMSAAELSNWQIEGLLKQNQHRSDVEPAVIAELREELARRQVPPGRPGKSRQIRKASQR